MDYRENIKYRRSIEEKVFSSEKLSDSEKCWLYSNPRFNECFDFPCYQSDVISIPQNSETSITITALDYKDNTKIYRPVISVVGKGVIKMDGVLFNTDRKKCDYKETRILIPLLNTNRTSMSARIVSKSGLISIAYQCEYYDERMKLYTAEMSDGAKLTYGMKKQNVSDSEFVYYCKSPTEPNDLSNSFDSFIFSIKILK